MVFKGFNIKYPIYTVVCPQSGFTYDVRSLNVSEVSKLKTSLTTPAKAPSLLNNVLWDSIAAKPSDIKSYNDFKRSTTLRDREALMYGLFQSTWGDEMNIDISCKKCGKSQSLKLHLTKMFSMNAFPFSESMKKTYSIARASGDADIDPEIEHSITKSNNAPEGMPEHLAKIEFGNNDFSKEDNEDGIVMGKKDDIKYVKEEKDNKKSKKDAKNKEDNTDSILGKRISVVLPVSEIVAVIKQPTIHDEEDIMSQISFAQKKQSDLVNETLVIDRFEQYESGAKVPSILITNREDILYGYQSLPPRDKTKMFDEFQENFGQYGIDLKTGYECESCGDANDIAIDIVVQFFRLLIRS